MNNEKKIGYVPGHEMSPKRFDLCGEYDCPIGEDEGGDYVSYSDFKKLEETLMKAIQRLTEQRDDLHKGMFGDNYMSSDNINSDNAEIIEILKGGAE